ncbi:MAG TPA: NADPH-dependent assimilatory sulfite reductase hemoprotein subunit [Azospirillaceae bacterium]|nr:NADPH-dependent assimilatory sulfite reductase hemoprotein subunit [Azospirillaceae bacterium]
MSEPVAQPKPSAVEGIKEASRRLRGTLAEALASDSPTFPHDDGTLLKFHGMYEGYDRDSATERKKQGLDKEWQLMIRARIPGGRLTAEQYLVLDGLAGRLANGTLRATTRQAIQFHGVVKGDVKALIQEINAALLNTIAACGDVVRNVMALPAPVKDAIHAAVYEDAALLSRHLLPRSRAYHEIWLDGEKLPDSGAEEEPLYGATYLPRKFKIAMALPEDNTPDVLANDLGLIAIVKDGKVTGYNVAIGGGMGRTHNNAKTYPRLASLVCYVKRDNLVPLAEAVVKLHRDHGDRSDRRHARLKYVVEEKGVTWAKARLEEYLGRDLKDPKKTPAYKVKDHLGWHRQGDGKWYLGVPVPSGRIGDDLPYQGGTTLLRTALRRVVETFRPSVILMPTQDVILADIAPADRDAVEAELRRFGVRLAQDLLPIERWSLACPALPTCGLALTEAERVHKPILKGIAEALTRHGLEGEHLAIRITGCPNGCARPYNCDIGLVGRMPGHYQVLVGGDLAGTRLNTALFDRVAEADLAATLEPLFAAFARDRKGGEGFGDFCHRVGIDRLKELAGGELEPAE